MNTLAPFSTDRSAFFGAYAENLGEHLSLYPHCCGTKGKEILYFVPQNKEFPRYMKMCCDQGRFFLGREISSILSIS